MLCIVPGSALVLPGLHLSLSSGIILHVPGQNKRRGDRVVMWRTANPPRLVRFQHAPPTFQLNTSHFFSTSPRTFTEPANVWRPTYYAIRMGPYPDAGFWSKYLQIPRPTVAKSPKKAGSMTQSHHSVLSPPAPSAITARQGSITRQPACPPHPVSGSPRSGHNKPSTRACG